MNKRPFCEYFGIDLKLTWKIVRLKIPELKKKIIKIKHDLLS